MALTGSRRRAFIGTGFEVFVGMALPTINICPVKRLRLFGSQSLPKWRVLVAFIQTLNRRPAFGFGSNNRKYPFSLAVDLAWPTIKGLGKLWRFTGFANGLWPRTKRRHFV
ncbi:MAG: hypothetical protein LBJ61_02700 [Deltaproteobacteria bacterium]|jgi:hypothetical protein|nr:hypothetical protein [Deltaproteobacteria bacterium]